LSQEWQGSGDIEIENVDSIVLTQLKAIESTTIRNALLIDIYNGLNN